MRISPTLSGNHICNLNNWIHFCLRKSAFAARTFNIEAENTKGCNVRHGTFGRMGDDIRVEDIELILAAGVLFVFPPKSVFPSGYLDPVHASKFGVDHEPQCKKNVAFVGRGLWWEHVPKCCFASFEQACLLKKLSPEQSKSFQFTHLGLLGQNLECRESASRKANHRLLDNPRDSSFSRW